MWEKIKQLLDDDQFFYTLLILLVGLLGYTLGMASATSKSDTQSEVFTPLVFEQGAMLSDAAVTKEMIATGDYVASVHGTKYHFVWCGSADRINEENRVYFDSAEKARAAGYTPAATCEGLD